LWIPKRIGTTKIAHIQILAVNDSEILLKTTPQLDLVMWCNMTMINAERAIPEKKVKLTRYEKKN
jgi:hypothetical protein